MARKIIMVVEDEPDIIKLIIRSLNPRQFEVIGAESGHEAFAKLKHITPDLFLLDIMMPDIDGFEVCRRIKAQPALQNIPVVFLTARHNQEDVERGEKCGASGFFTKPFDPFELGEQLATFV